jgi:hypothetical protein
MSSNGCYEQASVLEGLVADGKTQLMNTTHVNRDANGNIVSYYAGSFDTNTREMLIFAGNAEIERSDSEVVGTGLHPLERTRSLGCFAECSLLLELRRRAVAEA